VTFNSGAGAGPLVHGGAEMVKARYMEEDQVVAHLSSADLGKAREQRPMRGDVKKWLFPFS